MRQTAGSIETDATITRVSARLLCRGWRLTADAEDSFILSAPGGRSAVSASRHVNRETGSGYWIVTWVDKSPTRIGAR
jgi:hypothetical protein